jgi:hypothetical protein
MHTQIPTIYYKLKTLNKSHPPYQDKNPSLQYTQLFSNEFIQNFPLFFS